MALKLTHSPWTTREPYTVAEGLETLSDAKSALRRRAQVVESRYPGAVCAIADDGLSMEISDDDALMIGDYQGITSVEDDDDDL